MFYVGIVYYSRHHIIQYFIRDTWQTEGITALFKGGGCRIIVIAPLYAIAQAVYYFGIAEAILGIDRQKSVK